MRSSKWIALALVVMALMSLPAAYLLLGLQSSLEEYRPARQPNAPATVSPADAGAPSSGVVLVVIDGLRDDVSQKMPYLYELRKTAAYGTMRSGQPSFSKPSYTVISSGAWQEVTGIVLNSSVGPTAVDTIFRSARRTGLRVAMDAHEWWEEVNGASAFDQVLKYGDDLSHDPAVDPTVRDRALQLLNSPQPPTLTVIHFTWVDTQGHAHGAASKEYLDAALAIDAYLKDIVAAVDLSRQTLMITADHGHLSHNNGGGSGHGGWEPELTTVPFVMLGAGVKPGQASSLCQVDVAPTIAALLGIAVPADAQGRILWDSLVVTNDYKARYESSENARLAAVQSAEVAREARLRKERTVRAVIATALLAVGSYFLSRTAKPIRRTVLTAAALYPVAYYLAYAVALRNPFSLAAFPDASVMTFVKIICLPVVLAIAFVYLAVGLLMPLPRHGGGPGLPGTLTAANLGAMLAALVVYGVGYVANGARVTWCLPDFLLGFLQLSALLQFAVIGLLGWIAPAVSTAVGRARR